MRTRPERPEIGFERILVPTDLTSRTVSALDLAARLSAPGRSRVTLVHVIETVRGIDFDDLKGFYRKLERKARTEMARLKQRAGRLPVDVDEEILYGRRAEEIVGFARRTSVDLIVLASHKVNPSLVGRDWGSISYKVGILAQCPVLLVK
ncbi:MAG TPA: universal stress protein [Vicinamibacterales bacterium]|jgi:universal stress protein A|nr:universal stress protein [Vicinamibacterales bacterium]